MDIESILQRIVILPESSLNKLVAVAETVELPKGHLLFREDRTENNIYFIQSGIVRAFHYHNGAEVTFWFGLEGDPVLSMRSYVENKPGYETIELLEKAILYKFSIRDLFCLYEEDMYIANWGRKLAEKELLKTEQNHISRLFKTARERYEELMEQNPVLLQRIQLGYIASYLGITQVTLSRIRANLT